MDVDAHWCFAARSKSSAGKVDCSENGGYSVVVAGSKSTRKICLIISIVSYLQITVAMHNANTRPIFTLCSEKSDAKIEITITTSNLIRIKHPLSNFNYWLSGANIANFNKIHRTVPEPVSYTHLTLPTNREV